MAPSPNLAKLLCKILDFLQSYFARFSAAPPPIEQTSRMRCKNSPQARERKRRSFRTGEASLRRGTKHLAPSRVLQIASHAVVIGTIVRRVSLAAYNAQIAVIELVAVLVHNKRVPVAKLMCGLAQLARQRQLGLALLAIKGTLALKLCQQAAIEPKADKRCLKRICKRTGLAVVHVAEQGSVARAAQQIDLGRLELELHHDKRTGAIRILAHVGNGSLHLEIEHLGGHIGLFEPLFKVERHHVDAHVCRRAQCVQTVTIQRAHKLVLAGITVVQQVEKVLGHALLL